jgi:hypothetical protein
MFETVARIAQEKIKQMHSDIIVRMMKTTLTRQFVHALPLRGQFLWEIENSKTLCNIVISCDLRLCKVMDRDNFWGDLLQLYVFDSNSCNKYQAQAGLS